MTTHKTNIDIAIAMADVLNELLENHPEAVEELLEVRTVSQCEGDGIESSSKCVYRTDNTLSGLGLVNGLVAAATNCECTIRVDINADNFQIINFEAVQLTEDNEAQ